MATGVRSARGPPDVHPSAHRVEERREANSTIVWVRGRFLVKGKMAPSRLERFTSEVHGTSGVPGVCGLRSGSARGRIFYPDSVAGAAPEGGPCQRSRRRGWTVGPSAPPEPVVGFTRPEPAQECTVGLGCVGTGAVDLTIQSDRTSAAVKSGRIA